MKMIENVDSVVTRSSQDLWAEICSCLPDPNLKEGSRDAFADSFTDSYISGKSQDEELCGSFQANLKPWAPLKDSEIYLASLERRLMRVKGLSQEVTSKDMLHTLAQAKKECWDRFLQEKFESECYVEGHESEESTLELLKRWLQPDKVAISTEEVQYLIPPESHVEKQETEESPAAEQ
ncbi:coiled-coil domain-containing protein 32 [Pelodiscus sinensis]|uniref:Coiled-coil domain containing 32 n=1 Tax=Pelodiscus sinensis TaxID=13735 RepID=K7G0K8_PELSI|nr:coiled-coil domain-containing protein 32 [Pelodiscus sinensis]|eukprot:XP_006128724.1 coiled-coil domain-containing protein 32 [Pelodiscus sinensis]